MIINGSYSKNFKGIQFFPGEEALYVRREHAIVVFFPLIIVAVVASLTVSFVLTAVYLKYIQDLFYLILVLLLAVALLSFLATFAVYIFMRWFYQFYIITNRRLIRIQYFRIGGFHLDEVFYLQTRPTEIERHPRNFLLDFLGIEDVFVFFKNLERTVPFIFEFPPDSARIEELLETHLLLERNGR